MISNKRSGKARNLYLTLEAIEILKKYDSASAHVSRLIVAHEEAKRCKIKD